MAMTEFKIVTKESAKKLREMGHNDFCDCYYHTDNDDPYDYEMGHHQVCNESFEEYHERIAAPYVSEALLWLMHFEGIAFDVKTEYDEKSESGFVYVVNIKYKEDGSIICRDIDYQEALKRALHMLLVETRIAERKTNYMYIQKEV